MNRVSDCSTRVSHYHEIVQIVAIDLAVRALYIASFNAGLISEYLIPCRQSRHWYAMYCYGLCTNCSPELSILKFSSPFKSLFSGNIGRTCFRFGTVKFRARDARTMHGDYRLVWGTLRLAPIN